MAAKKTRKYHKPKGIAKVLGMLPSVSQLGGIALLAGAAYPRHFGVTDGLGVQVVPSPLAGSGYDAAVNMLRNVPASIATNKPAHVAIGLGLLAKLAGVRSIGGIRLW